MAARSDLQFDADFCDQNAKMKGSVHFALSTAPQGLPRQTISAVSAFAARAPVSRGPTFKDALEMLVGRDARSAMLSGRCSVRPR